MASGLEIAGLILGAISPITSFLETYKDFRNYKTIIENLSEDLNTQSLLFRDTCERLFDGLSWHDESLEKKLRRRLSEDDYTHCMKMMKRINNQIEQLRMSFGLAPHGMVCHSPRSSKLGFQVKIT